MGALADWIHAAPAGFWPVLIITGLWSGVFDAHVSQRMGRYPESKLLRGIGLTYLCIGIVLWITSTILG